MTETSLRPPQVTTAPPPPSPARPSFGAAIAAVVAGQTGRLRVARIPLLFVAGFQSLGIEILLRGVVHHGDRATAAAIVAGATVLVVGFVGLNLLAQRFGALRTAQALDYYAALPVPPAAVVLGTAASYAGFAVPGAVATLAVGAAIYDLPLAQVWVAIPALLAAATVLPAVGALLGLGIPRPELATIAGQLGMTAVLFLGIVPPSHLPEVARVLRDIVPGMLSVDALAAALRHSATFGEVAWRLLVTIGYGAILLAVADRLFRRAVDQ